MVLLWVESNAGFSPITNRQDSGLLTKFIYPKLGVWRLGNGVGPRPNRFASPAFGLDCVQFVGRRIDFRSSRVPIVGLSRCRAACQGIMGLVSCSDLVEIERIFLELHFLRAFSTCQQRLLSAYTHLEGFVCPLFFWFIKKESIVPSQGRSYVT